MTTVCLFYHPKDREEHEVMFKQFEQARACQNFSAMMAYLKCLTACECGWKPTPKEEAHVEAAN